MKKYGWHILFWIVYMAGWSWFSMANYHATVWMALAVTSTYWVAQAGLVYLIIYVWVPRYLRPKRTLRFIAWVLGGLIAGAAVTTAGSELLLRHIASLSIWSYFGYTLIAHTYWIILALIFVTVRDRFRGERKREQQEKERTEAELRLLKSQMNPHFLFNALNSIYVLIKKDPDLAEHTLAGFSDMLRYQLYECSVEQIAIEKEVTYLENFIRLECLRRGDTLHVDYQKETGAGRFLIAPQLIFPLVENAFKYVSSYTDRDNRIVIRLAYAEPEFTLEVTNTVELREPGDAPGGIGLGNVRRRLALLYPGRHSLEVKAGTDQYTVLLKVQVL